MKAKLNTATDSTKARKGSASLPVQREFSVAQNNLLRKKTILERQLEQIFLKEFEFLVDIAEGRAQAKENFADKVASVVGIAGALVPGEVGGTGLALALGAVQKGLSYMSQWEKDKASAAVKAFSVERPREELQLAIRIAAHEFATMYEFQLHHLKREALPQIALVAATRLLDYMVHQLEPSLATEELINGMRSGRSGGGVTAWANTALEMEGSWPFKWYAEGLFARVALMNERRSDHFLIHNDRAVVNMKRHRGEAIPKYGYIRVSETLFQEAQAQTSPYTVQWPGQAMREYLTSAPFIMQTISIQDLMSYIMLRKQRPHLTLNDYVAEQYQLKGKIISRFRGQFTEGDLSGGLFAEVDFCLADFSGSNLSGANFEGSWFMGAKLDRVQAIDANFHASHFEQASLNGINLSNATLTNVHAEGASFAGAILLGANREGMLTSGANFYGSSTQERVMVLDEHIANLRKIAQEEVAKDSTIAQGLALYVPLAGSTRIYNTEGEDLEKEVRSFLKSTTARIFLLQGNSGSGKSLFARYIEKKLWDE